MEHSSISRPRWNDVLFYIEYLKIEVIDRVTLFSSILLITFIHFLFCKYAGEVKPNEAFKSAQEDFELVKLTRLC